MTLKNIVTKNILFIINISAMRSGDSNKITTNRFRIETIAYTF